MKTLRQNIDIHLLLHGKVTFSMYNQWVGKIAGGIQKRTTFNRVNSIEE